MNSSLRQRMTHDLQLAGLSARTQEAYLRAVRQLADHFHTPPDRLTESQLRDYFLHLKNDRNFAAASLGIAYSGIKFFYSDTIPRDWPTLKRLRVPREKPGQPCPAAGSAATAIAGWRRAPTSWCRSRRCRSSTAPSSATCWRAGLLEEVDPSVWQQDWVVHCQSAGDGRESLRYLAPYVFRVAIGDHRIVSCDDGRVTFTYRRVGSQRRRQMTLDATEFLRRFLQHVLPSGLPKVRHYGFLSPASGVGLESGAVADCAVGRVEVRAAGASG